ncbi:MAG TPA: ABC transporter ATP-binding protein [Thermoleophilaceae bacterium]|nr:ABC transporter ATP-binding protein [Thermoleophilaceae bacterium]
MKQSTSGPASPAGPLVAAAPALALRAVLKRFWPYARPYRRWLLLVLVLIALGQALDAASLWLFKVVIDEVLVPRDFGPFPLIALGYVAITVVGGAVAFGDDYLSTWIGERFVLSLRTDFFRHLQGLSLGFFEGRRLGDLLSRLTGDVGAIETLVLSGVADAVGYVLRIVFFAGALFLIDWRLALVALVVSPLFAWATSRFSRRIKEASREKRRRSGSISSVAEESLANVSLVQAYNRQAHEVERLHEENLGAFRAEMRSTRLKALFRPLIDLVEVLGALVVLGAGTWALSRGELTLGDLLAFVAFLSQLYSPIRALMQLINRFFSASAGAERIIEFLDEEPEVAERPDARRLGRAFGRVRFDDVSFSYPGGGRPALGGLSFELMPGEALALVGPSGAGKSTVAKLLLRFYDPSDGTIEVDGDDLRDLGLESLRDNVSVLLQETLVFDGSVRENIAYGKTDASDEEIVAAAQAADAHDFVSAMPDGYDTRIGQRGRRLSGGQRQRIAIARAMVRDAPILVLDEPTTALDAESGERVMEPLRRLMSGRATLVISHNLITAREADQILVLDAGREVERGSHAELMAVEGAYARLYRLHQGELVEA